MCGIAGFYFHNPQEPPLTGITIEKLVSKMLLEIEHRGHDATGVAAVTASGELHIEKADIEAMRFNWWRSDLPAKPQTVLLHTRYATQGTPMVLANNHPIHYEDVLVTHNGHISNDDRLFEDENIERKAEVDSEIIAALFQKYGIDKAHIPLGKLDGNFAVAVSDLRQPGTLVLAKGWSSPLFYYEANEGLMWASTQDTIIKAAKEAMDLKIERRDIDSLSMGKLLLIQNGEVEKLDFKLYERPKTYQTSYFDSRDSYYNRTWSRNNVEDEKQDETRVKKEREEKIASDPKHIEFWENESHDIAFTCKVGNVRFIFKNCDGCNNSVQTTHLTKVTQGFIFCTQCLTEFDEKVESTSENPAVVHEVVIELVAERFKTNPDFVNWLLFESDEDDIDADGDPNLVSLYIEFVEAYDEIHLELTGETLGSANRLADVAEEIEGCGVEVFDEDEIEQAIEIARATGVMVG